MATTLIGIPILHFYLSDTSPYFDISRGWHQIVSNPTLIITSLTIMVGLGAFNFFALSMTARASATTRTTIDMCRPLCIWLISLSLRWESLVWPASLLQVAGFAMLV